MWQVIGRTALKVVFWTAIKTSIAMGALWVSWVAELYFLGALRLEL